MKVVPTAIFGALPLSSDLNPLAQLKILVEKSETRLLQGAIPNHPIESMSKRPGGAQTSHKGKTVTKTKAF